MLLFVINSVTAQLIRRLIIKLTSSCYVKKCAKMYVAQGKQGEFHLSWNVATLSYVLQKLTVHLAISKEDVFESSCVISVEGK